MALDREDFADKTLSGKEATTSNKRLIEELGAKTLTLHAEDVYSDRFDSDPATELLKTSPKVAQVSLFALTVDPSVPSNQAWKAGVGDWVPDQFGAGYAIQFFDGSNSPIGIPDQISRDFRFNYKTGILTSSNTSGLVLPIKVSGYRYSGLLAADVLIGKCVPDVDALLALNSAALNINDEVKVLSQGVTWKYNGGDPALETSWRFLKGVGKPEFVAGDITTDARIYIRQITTGNDLTGDGTQLRPYKTVQRAIADMPLATELEDVTDAFNLPAYSIRFDEPGDYVMAVGESWDAKGRMGSWLEIVAYQDQQQVITDAQAGALAAVVGKEAQSESAIGVPVTPVVGDSDHFALWTFDAIAFGYPTNDYFWGAAIIGSSNPATTLRLVAKATGGFAPFAWKDRPAWTCNINSYSGGTRIRKAPSDFAIDIFGGTFGEQDSGTNRFAFLMGLDFVDPVINHSRFQTIACRFSNTLALRNFSNGSLSSTSGVALSNTYVGAVSIGRKGSGRMSGIFLAGITLASNQSEFGGLNCAILRGNNPYVVGDRVEAPVVGFNSAVDFEGSGACVIVDGGRCRFTSFLGRISLAGTHNRVATVREGGLFDNSGGARVPAGSGQGVAGEPFEAKSRGQVTGIAVATDLPVNTITPGNDVKLGATIVAYGALPAADPLELSRAE